MTIVPSAPDPTAPLDAASRGRRRHRPLLDPNHRTTRVVLNALDLLETFADGEGEQGVSAIAARLGLAKNNVFRILATLEARGYVEQDRRSERYRLAPGSLRLGLSMLEQVGLARQARPVLDTLASETGETARLGVLRGHAAVYVAQSDMPERAVQVVLPVGAALPLHATAVGKVLLAHDPGEMATLLAGRGPLAGYTTLTIRDPRALASRLPAIASGGHALDDGEYAPDVRCLAAPVRDYARRVVGAISLSGPAGRLTDARLAADLVPRLEAATRSLSRCLGYAGTE